MSTQSQPEGLALLRVPFPANQVNKLPKPYRADSAKGNCRECGGFHGLPAMHLDFVGHAALTDRFLDADPAWSWEPLAFGPDGLPAYDKDGGMWIKLTICGVTRLGYGDAQGKKGPNAIKEIIGDALRNAGMRFGAALDLWHKGDLHDAATERGDNDAEPPTEPPTEPAFDDPRQYAELIDLASSLEQLNSVGSTIATASLSKDDRSALRVSFTNRMAELKKVPA